MSLFGFESFHLELPVSILVFFTTNGWGEHNTTQLLNVLVAFFNVELVETLALLEHHQATLDLDELRVVVTELLFQILSQ